MGLPPNQLNIFEINACEITKQILGDNGGTEFIA